MIPGLLDISDWDEATVNSRLDAAGGLVTPAYVADLLGTLLRTETIITGAIVGLDRLDGEEFADAGVRALAGLPPSLTSSRLVSYLKPILKAAIKYWKSEWATLLAPDAVLVEVACLRWLEIRLQQDHARGVRLLAVVCGDDRDIVRQLGEVPRLEFVLPMQGVRDRRGDRRAPRC
jgi:hypothetical protein